MLPNLFERLIYEIFVHQIWKKKISAGLRPFFKIVAKILNLSTEYFVLDLKNKNPTLFLLKKQSAINYKNNQVNGNLIKLSKITKEKGQIDKAFYNRQGNQTLELLKQILLNKYATTIPIIGICHGVRSGFENIWLQNNLPAGSVVFGTDISPSILDFENGIEWDFHAENEDWINKFDFVFSNSLDHAIDPLGALKNWLFQIKSGGSLFLELGSNSGKIGFTGLDVFSIEPEIFPFFLLRHFSGLANLRYIHQISKDDSRRLLFEICRQ